MATALKGDLRILLRTILEPGITGVTGGVVQTIDIFKSIANGTGADQADRVWYDSAALGSSANTTIDLAGSLLDVYGNAISFAKVTGIVLQNRSTTCTLAIGPNASNGFGSGTVWSGTTPRSLVRPGGALCWYDPAGAAVTAATADLIYLENLTAASCDYRILILGKSA